MTDLPHLRSPDCDCDHADDELDQLTLAIAAVVKSTLLRCSMEAQVCQRTLLVAVRMATIGMLFDMDISEEEQIVQMREAEDVARVAVHAYRSAPPAGDNDNRGNIH